MASKKIRYTDPKYKDIWEDWVKEGRPERFERYGSFGGALYSVKVPEDRVSWDGEEYPDFYQKASIGPTVLSDDFDIRPTDDGWAMAHKRDGFSTKIRIKEDSEGTLILVKQKDFPNELEVSET